ncbi:MAG TPA: hypothetical protein VGZ52_02525 [Acidimicrobiales bacterium]|jgi:hypothetical protein|nr:hypothetical protein [Acidimicrobiales bacterium]
MEKVIYVLWRRDGESPADFAAHLLGPMTDALVGVGVHGLQVNVADEAVAPAVVKVRTLDPQMEAIVGVWLHSANDSYRRPVDDIVHATAARCASYLVTESVPLPNTTRRSPLRRRTDGFANVAFLRRPERLTEAEWLDAWLNGQTPVAVATQSTFGYTQNVVVRTLSDDAPPFRGIVEELFPPEALTDLHAFFDAPGDDDRLTRHMTEMGASTDRFGATEAIDVVPTSQYVILA